MGQLKTQILFFFFFSVLLSGCISQNRWQWAHPDISDSASRKQAILKCELIAEEEARDFDYFYPDPFYFDRFYRHDFNYPFFSRYYHYNSNREFQYRRRFFRICMKSKGWQLIRMPTPQQNIE